MRTYWRKDDPKIINPLLELYDSGLTSHRKLAKKLGEVLNEKFSRCLIKSILEQERNIKPSFKADTLEQVHILKGEGMTSQDVAEKLGLSLRTVDNVMTKARRFTNLEPSPQQHPETIAHRRSIAQSWKPGRYLVINDSHIKFHSPEAFEEVFVLKGQFDGCIFVGDFVDAHWLSTFAKHGYVAFASEITTATIYMHRLVKKFGRVLYLQGNHEQRLMKRIIGGAENIANLVHDQGAQKIVYKALNDVREWYFGKWPGVTTHYGWFVQVGKALLTHADIYSVIHGRAAMNIVEHMMGYAQAWKLDPVDTVMEAHLHRHTGPMKKWGYYVWELPCMCGPLDYQLESRARKGQVDTGWSILEQHKDGSLRFNGSRTFYLNDGPA